MQPIDPEAPMPDPPREIDFLLRYDPSLTPAERHGLLRYLRLVATEKAAREARSNSP